MKKLTLVLLCLINLSVLSQKSIDKPSQAEWDVFIEHRILEIQKDLFQLALDGKIKPYKYNSFTYFYTPADLKAITTSETAIALYNKKGEKVRDSIVIEPLDPNELRGIQFCRSIPTELLSFSNEEKLLGISILHTPIFFGIKSDINVALCYFSIEDITRTLSSEKLKFLQLAYQYARINPSYDPTIDSLQNIENNNLDLIFRKRNELPLSDLQLDAFKYSIILYSDLMSNIKGYTYYDYQLKKESKYNEFPFNYYHVEIVLLPGESDLDFYDTTIHVPAPFALMSQINYNPKWKVISFIYSLDASESHTIKPAKNEKDLKFSISRSELDKYTNLHPMLWLFEDYYAWKMKRKGRGDMEELHSK